MSIARNGTVIEGKITKGSKAYTLFNEVFTASRKRSDPHSVLYGKHAKLMVEALSALATIWILTPAARTQFHSSLTSTTTYLLPSYHPSISCPTLR